ncbi:hypothetical protein ACEQ8H_002461 [Pleosporales sp. CAS-2024a]
MAANARHNTPSPFDDGPYPETRNPSAALAGYPPSPSFSSQQDPFTDHNAIPLHAQPHMDRPHKLDDSPSRYHADPEAYPRPRRKRTHKKKKKKKEGWFSGRITWVVFALTTVQAGVFVGELIKNALLTGSPIETKPSFNIMIGPSPYVLINMGSRFTPCMHNINQTIANNVQSWPCPNTTDLDAASLSCSLSELCGMGGVPSQAGVTNFHDRSHEPNQWWRFITPIFLHAGLIHIGFNMLLQLTLGRDMEKEIGAIRFAIVYFSAGIFGFVLGGNYAADGLSSVGASGSLFGILALTLLDLFYNWRTRSNPVKDLLFILLDIGISFVLGLLPGLDNFSHIGGFLMGLVLGMCLLHSPQALRERIGHAEPPYATVDTQPLGSTDSSEAKQPISHLAKAPVTFFKGRKPLWWAWWLVRAGGLVSVFIAFILLLRNFYEWRNTCSWCKHLTCLPITTGGVDWCDMGGLNLQKQNTSSNPAKRGLGPVDLADFVAAAMGASM